MRLFKRKEERAEVQPQATEVQPQTTVEEALLSALIGNTCITKEMALQIPSARGCVDKLASTVSQLPIRLYRREGKAVTEITEDPRLRLLNDDTGDTLNANEFWKSMIEDYFFGKGAFAYINKTKGEVSSLHYVREEDISFIINTDPIFKNYRITVYGKDYFPFDFLKLKRKTKDGAKSLPLQEENKLIFSVAYNTLLFEDTLVKKGGNKKGFIESEKSLADGAIKAIKEAWKNLYSNNTDNVVVLNNGAKFKESSNTSVEMQLNENKKTNGDEICKIIGFPPSILIGNATAEDKKQYISCVDNILTVIETALDRDLLLEKEKGSFYFAFDTRELTRGDQKERYESYEIALRNNFLQVDEVRKLEDQEPLGLNFVRIGLQDVLINPETMKVYTPNTNATVSLDNLEVGGTKDEN